MGASLSACRAPCFRPGQGFLPATQVSWNRWEFQLCVQNSSGELQLLTNESGHGKWPLSELRSVAHLCLPDIYSSCQMQWHATAELKDVHSLFNDEVQQVITSVLQTAACPAPVGLRRRKVTLKQQPCVSSLAQLLETVLFNLEVSKDLEQSKFCSLACSLQGTGGTSGSASIASARSWESNLINRCVWIMWICLWHSNLQLHATTFSLANLLFHNQACSGTQDFRIEVGKKFSTEPRMKTAFFFSLFDSALHCLCPHPCLC